MEMGRDICFCFKNKRLVKMLALYKNAGKNSNQIPFTCNVRKILHYILCLPSSPTQHTHEFTLPPPQHTHEVPVGQEVKRCPEDLAVSGSIPVGCGNHSNRNRGLLHTVFHHYPPIVLQCYYKGGHKIASHSSTPPKK